ncbi:MAG: iron-sulfur cluster assembly scaffold protein [bacterium]
MTNFYQEILLDHYKNPRNKGTIQSPDFSSGLENPSCGDTIVIQGTVEHDVVTKLSFSGSGCVISQAAASMLTELCTGKTVDDILALTKDDIIKLLGIQLGPVRLKCAVLALQALHKGILEFKKK